MKRVTGAADGQVCLRVFRKRSRGGREFDGAIEVFELLVGWLGGHGRAGVVSESIKKNFGAVMGQGDNSVESQFRSGGVFGTHLRGRRVV